MFFNNVDAVPHTVTAGTPDSPAFSDFDSGLLTPGSNYEISFDKPGNYSLFCTLHPDMVAQVTDQLARWGEVRRGYVGVNLREVRDFELARLDYSGASRVAVRSVVKGGPAEQAGLEPGDVVVRVNNRPVTTVQSLMAVVASFAPGTEVELEVRRDQLARKVSVRLGERPQPE